MPSGQEIVDYLKQFIGLPYVWGGNSLKTGVDCSGLIQQGFKHFGISLPRVTYDQIGQGAAVSVKGLRVGDLVFFDTDKGTAGPDHVGIYMGGGKMLHTPRPGKSVEIADMSAGYYMDRFMGGRRISGVTSVGNSSADAASPEEAKKLTPEELASNYGWAYGFLNSNSELKKLFNEAVKNTWTPEKFQAELRDTKWWKTTSDTRREAQVIKKTDPATWNAQVAAGTIQVQQLAAQIGAAIPSNKLNGIVMNMLETGMDEDQLRNALGQYVTFTKDGTLKGEAGMYEYKVKEFAAQNGITLDNQAVKNQAQLIVRKVATQQDFESQIRTQAKSMFPGYAEQIDAGMTVQDIASPYMQTMSQELGIPDTSITVSDPLIKEALNGLNKDGKPSGKTLTDFQSQLRNDPRWKQTDGAQDNVMAAGLSVLRQMGLIGGVGEQG